MILKRSDAAKIALHFCGKACDTSNLLGSSARVRYKVGSFRSPSEVHLSLRPCYSAYRRFRCGSRRASQLCPSTGVSQSFAGQQSTCNIFYKTSLYNTDLMALPSKLTSILHYLGISTIRARTSSIVIASHSCSTRPS
jgi:hypothetical protein